MTDGWIELKFTDSDSDEHARTRFRKWVEEDMTAFAETLVKEQLVEGFVEVPPSDSKGVTVGRSQRIGTTRALRPELKDGVPTWTNLELRSSLLRRC